MKITAIPQFARNLNRAQEVVRILSKYGLADWLSQLNIGFGHGLFRGAEGDRLADLTREARVRLALTELGTTFIKLGQVLSTRADLVGLPMAVELAKLQADVPADKPEIVRAIIEKELHRKVDDLFEAFEDVPLASASIAQVHRAILPGGRKVVVKVQHPNIENRIRNDLEILAGLAELSEKYVEEAKLYQPRAVTAEFEKTLLRELDFGRELRNLERFLKNFEGDPNVRFPRPHAPYSTARVLVMDLLEGTPVALAGAIGTPHYREELARKGARVFLQMIFRDGFFHADPHPGNWLILPEGVVGILDVGMVGQLTPPVREDMEDLLISIGTNDPQRLTDCLTRMCADSVVREPTGLTADVSDFLGYHYSQPLDRLSISAALNEMTDIIRRHHLILPTAIAMLLRVLVLLEGTSRLLHPQFRLTDVIEPFQRKMVAERLSPMRQYRRLRAVVRDWQELVGRLPDQLRDMLQQARTGRIEVQLEHHHLQPAVNRLVLGLVTAALLVGSSILWGLKAPPTIEGVSVLGVMGFTASAVCAGRLMVAVFRSGNLD
ncbi:MAG: ABC1 kinase family protein [Gemmataceae bacterium]